ncbi:hypothetical protein PoB_003188900 [Plakobranchus ocellatus]|uniref:Uncharacterized protein n=1 Tax=Plakobranchus ocellatus TaxID=259542 RepID=A0AAV4AGL0_9GAST|nr:hypothetical protein PoB_003188900 [Plakobranchus ocellatus]
MTTTIASSSTQSQPAPVELPQLPTPVEMPTSLVTALANSNADSGIGDSGLGRAPEIEVETNILHPHSETITKRHQNIKSLLGASCDSDHIPVMCKFQIKLKQLRKAKANPKFQVDLLKSDEKLRDKIAIAVHNKYETLNNISEVEELWSERKNSLDEVIN